MFYTALPAESIAKVASGPLLDYDAARDMLIASPETRVYAYVERVETPYIAGPLTSTMLSDLAPAIGFAWRGATIVPIGGTR